MNRYDSKRAEKLNRTRQKKYGGSRMNRDMHSTPQMSKQTHRDSRKQPVRNHFHGSRQQRRWKRMLRRLKRYSIAFVILIAMAAGIIYFAVWGLASLFRLVQGYPGEAEIVRLDGEIEKMTMDAPAIDVDLLTINKYSRPGTKMKSVKGIVIHYVGNPGTTAAQNRSYFESLKDTHEASASSHFIVGIDGEIVQCIPTSEVAYCSNERNDDTIAIECCHKKSDGKFTEETYDSLVQLTAFLCCKYDLEIEDIIRHYDVTGKQCPKYYVVHEDKWTAFKEDVAEYIEDNAYRK